MALLISGLVLEVLSPSRRMLHNIKNHVFRQTKHFNPESKKIIFDSTRSLVVSGVDGDHQDLTIFTDMLHRSINFKPCFTDLMFLIIFTVPI